MSDLRFSIEMNGIPEYITLLKSNLQINNLTEVPIYIQGTDTCLRGVKRD